MQGYVAPLSYVSSAEGNSMDAAHFDALAKSLSVARSRRGALAASLGGALGLAGLTQTDARNKKPCPPCKKRKKGKCKGRLPDGTGCAGGACLSGVCVAGKPPSSECLGKPDNTRCEDRFDQRGRCLAGVCNPKPYCASGNVIVTDPPGCSVCCSGRCQLLGNDPVCAPSVRGETCDESSQCADGLACIGYRCGDPYVCPPEAPNLCAPLGFAPEGCVPAACDRYFRRCGSACNPQNDTPCGDCEPYLTCDFDQDFPEQGYRCLPRRFPLRTCPPAAPKLCSLGPVEGCVPTVCRDAGRCWARCNPQNENPCGGCEPYLVCDFDPSNQEDGYRCRPQVPPTTVA
jgi:hypothetical protein